MNDMDRAGPDHANEAPQGEHQDDSWEMFADAMDLTIEGHRLIAQEIVYETKLLAKAIAAWLHDLIGTMAKWRSSPPV
jgi:hypothetical protein